MGLTIHFCLVDKACRDSGAPIRLYIMGQDRGIYIGWLEVGKTKWKSVDFSD